MKWCGETQDLHYKSQNHSHAVRKGPSTAAPQPWAGLAYVLSLGHWKAIGEAIKHPSDPSTLLKFLVARVRIQLGNKIWRCTMLIQKNHRSSNTKDKNVNLETNTFTYICIYKIYRYMCNNVIYNKYNRFH